MTETPTEFIDVARLRIGHYIHLDVGWMSHPFPLNSFKIHSKDQIEAIRTLGLRRIRYFPLRSDPDPEATAPAAASAGEAFQPLSGGPRRELLAEQRAGLEQCERLFSQASRTFRRITDLAHARPEAGREAAQALVQDMSDGIDGAQESCIRLLSEKIGERASVHAINVTVISLLLARACGMDEAALAAVGLGALLHDVGKIDLPERLRYHNGHLTTAEQQFYQEHVRYGVEIARKMNLHQEVVLAIGQHHEQADGNGYPARIDNGRMAPAARIVSLVDRYDNLCNPGNPCHALTPHEAMSHLFAQRKHCFDNAVLTTFIRMMGVYPPGSVVQLGDGRYALVVSVNASRPLKPCVVIHDPAVPREEALVADLGGTPELGIRRSLRPLQLPRASFDYLSPRQRLCYFFEPGRASADGEC